jgi:hypothetical protein
MNTAATAGQRSGRRLRRRCSPGCPAQWYGAAPPASRLLRIADATALRAGPDPGDLCGPSGRKHGQATPAPRSARGTPRCPLAEQDHHTESLHGFRGLTQRQM